jgi:hypothetical protein
MIDAHGRGRVGQACGIALGIALMAGSSGCARPPYMEAVSAHARATEVSAETLAEAPGLAAHICFLKARYTYLQAHLGLVEGREVSFGKWFSSAKATDALTWRSYCDEVASAGAAFGDAVGVLQVYAGALSKLGHGARYDGSDVKGLLSTAGTLAGAQTPTGKAISVLAAPLSGLASLLIESHSERDLADFTAAAAPHVAGLLDGVDIYLDALEKDVEVLEPLPARSLDRMESAAFAEPYDPTKVRQLLDWGLAVDEEMAALRARIAGYARVTAALRKTQEALARSRPGEDVRPLLGGVAATLTQVQKLRAASAATLEEGGR